ncbi:adenosine deaminase [Gulosibacter hominis]|uniref:adenosine deaminase n=1 Tax=Gulosibacter hominis TaxID=2770504 RepID=UPI001E65D677|nr:adenosine deaminase [Gulosibacter hominis]
MARIEVDRLMLADGIDAREVPKVLLHDHLDGGLRPATIIELAQADDIALPAEIPEALGEWFRTAADSGSLERYLETFALTVAVMQSAANLERVAREAVLDLAADGVVYAELRWAPEQHQQRGLDLDEAVASVRDGITAGMQLAAERGHDIRVQQLICAMRQADRSAEIAELAVRHASPEPGGVCGFDLAGPEAGFPPSNHLAALDYCCRHWLPATCHAGEADGIESITSALRDARALRLGHGTRLIDNITLSDGAAELGAVARWVRDRRITVESCPSSNLQTGTPSLAAHPFEQLFQLGFSMTVNTDNRLMSATSVSRELALLAAEFDYTLDEVELLQLNAAEGAFLPVAEREALAERITRRCEQLRRSFQPPAAATGRAE